MQNLVKEQCMRKKCITASAICLLGIFSPVFSDGLPGEFVLNGRWRDLLWYHSPLNNPAFIAEEDRITLRGTYSSVLQSAFNLSEIGATLPLFSNQALGLSIVTELDGMVNSAHFDETQNRIIAGENQISNTNYFAMISYASTIWRTLSFGANVNFATQTNFGDPLFGIGLDAGATWRLFEHNKIHNHLFGISTLNLIAPNMGSEPGAYSKGLKLSWAGRFADSTLETGVDLDLRDFWARARDFTSGSGNRTDRKVEWGLAGRAGYWFLNMVGLWGQIGFDERTLEYWGLAAGAKIPYQKGIGNAKAFYQYNIKAEGEGASSHSFYLIWSIGSSREEIQEIHAFPIDSSADETSDLRKLEDMQGVTVANEKEYVRIFAEETAVNFASGSAELPEDAIPLLKEIAIFLRKHPERPVTIEGHTDNDPITGRLKAKFKNNIELSQARCDAVKRYFVQKENIPDSRLKTFGYGETRPLYPNDTRENKRKNRRVLVIIKK